MTVDDAALDGARGAASGVVYEREIGSRNAREIGEGVPALLIGRDGASQA